MKSKPETYSRKTRSSTYGIHKPALPNKTKARSDKISSKPSQPKKRSSGKATPKCLQGYNADVDLNATSILFQQPSELFALIVSHLPIESLVCLSLTCKIALALIGNECWTVPEIKGHNFMSRKQLMECLIRDSPPNLTFCENCNTLHPLLRPPYSHRETKLTKTCMSQWALVDYFPQIKGDRGDGLGYSLLYPHIQEVFQNQDSTALLSGEFTITSDKKFDYTLESSASWINKNLVLQHIHTFQPKPKTLLQAKNLLSLPLQICPHHSTTTSTPVEPRHTTNRKANGPVLTHAIATAFPSSQKTGIASLNVFRAPTPLEQKQMTAVDNGEEVIWRCRGCATKFRVIFEMGGLVITTWHSFGADLIHAAKYWVWMVRREASNLGQGKRNSEFWYQTRTVPDFKIE